MDNKLVAKLPYGDQFSFVDEILELYEGRSIVTSKSFHGSMAVIRDHFGIVPGVILAEQVNQSALALGIASKLIPDSQRAFVGRIKSSFLKPAVAPCRLFAEVTFDRVLKEIVFFSGVVRDADGETYARFQSVSALTVKSN